MSILSVDNISPIGSGTSVTVNSAATLVLNNANSTGVITATSFVGNLTGNPTGTLQTAAQPNITSVGTLSSLTVSGNINVTSSDPTIVFVDSDNNPDFDIKAGGGRFAIRDSTNNAERLRIDSNGHVLLGTTTGGLTDYGDSLTIADAHAGMTLRVAATNQTSHIYFADGTSGDTQYRGYVQYHHNSDLMKFGTAATERLRISSNGDVRVGGGAPATFGSGTTVHETYNANTYVANLVTSGTHQLQMIASQTHGATSIGTRSNHDLNLCANDSTKMTITTDGEVLKPSNPAFLAGRTGGNQTFTLGTFPFNVARINVGNCYSTSTYKFTAPVAGIYYFHAEVYYNNGNGNYRVGFRKTPSGGSAFMLNTVGHSMVGNDNQQSTSLIESLAVGDTVELYSDQNASVQCYYNINDTTYGAHTYFMGYLIG